MRTEKKNYLGQLLKALMFRPTLWFCSPTLQSGTKWDLLVQISRLLSAVSFINRNK